MTRLLRTITRLGLSRGLGGSRGWLKLGLIAGGLRLIGKWIGDEPEVVYCETLDPGHTVTITHFTRSAKS